MLCLFTHNSADKLYSFADKFVFGNKNHTLN